MRLAEALPVYVKIGLLSFGGPAGQIALMQEEIVDRRRWVAPGAFQQGLNVAMVLPGPEAQQLATWLGWRLHGVRGGLAAGLAFILPGAVLMICLAWLAGRFGQIPLVAALFYGIQPAVLVIVVRAMRSLAGRALTRPADWVLALSAFAGLWAFGFPFPLIIALAVFSLILLVAPSIIVVIISFDTRAFVSFPPVGFTLRWYAEVFEQGDLVKAMLNSAQVGVTVTLFCIVLGVPTALACARGRFRGTTVLSVFVLVPHMVPGIVLGVAVLFAGALVAVSPSIWLQSIAITVFILAVMVRTVPSWFLTPWVTIT